MEQSELLKGTVETITYQNTDTGYCVLELNNGYEQVTVVGTLPYVHVGEQLTLQGSYVVHPTYGPQFKAQVCERSLPASAAEILRYLSSGAVKGVGPVTAAAIVEKFGEDTLKILKNEPGRLATIRGISMQKAEKISEEYKNQFGVREVMLKLASYGITAAEAMRIYKKLGAGSVEQVLANPYMLCDEHIGIGFLRADEIAAALPDSVEQRFRVQAGVIHVLRHNLGNGHTCLPADKLCSVAAGLLRMQQAEVAGQTQQMLDAGALAGVELDGRQMIFLPYMYQSERYCANRIALMRKAPPAEIPVHMSRLAQIEEQNGIIYDSFQKQAIASALSEGILVLTGGPGTGKTTTLNAMITLLSEAGANIALAAPTGRAAKRMSELCGREAKTIHRLLEVEWGEEEQQVFKRNETNPLSQDVIVIDELSMLDIRLFDALLRAMTVHCRLIMVGDVDQLPSVGAGNVLHDLIDSGAVPVVRLKRVFRQAMQSRIITNAHRIIAGQMPELQDKNSDFFFMNRKTAAGAAELAGDLFCQRLGRAYGFDPARDIQILCPSRKRQSGTMNLNNLIQQLINPPAPEKAEMQHKGFVMREGDKVMQVKNNYDVGWEKDDGTKGNGVFNGDIGTLGQISRAAGTMTVRFDDKTAVYAGEQMEDLELAYAVTVHKSQGSEFDCVILVLTDAPPPLCYRNLLYTAVTRAKKLLVVIGEPYELQRMVENNKKTGRYTGFRHFLMQAVQE